MAMIDEIAANVNHTVDAAARPAILEGLGHAIMHGTPQDLIDVFDRYPDKINFDDLVPVYWCTPLALAASATILAKGIPGCQHFRLLLEAGADPRKTCYAKNGDTVAVYLDGILEALDQTPPNEHLITIIGCKTGQVRQAISYIKKLINEKYPTKIIYPPLAAAPSLLALPRHPIAPQFPACVTSLTKHAQRKPKPISGKIPAQGAKILKFGSLKPS